MTQLIMLKRFYFTKGWRLLALLVTFMQPLPALSADNNDLALTEVIIENIEPGIEPFKSRLLLADHMLRLDDGNDQGDFILFDRDTREIHSFNHEDRSHLVMKPLKPEVLDVILNFSVESEVLQDAPKVKGVVPVQNLFYVDNKLCKKSINVQGLLPELTQVLMAYEQVIVEQSKRTLFQVPASVRSGCYMSNNYLHASDYLKSGFPLFVADDQGRQKKLLNFHQILKNKSIMQKPEGYSLYYPNASNLPE